MTDDQAKTVAAQLRQPEGEFGKIVGQKMNEANLNMNVFTNKQLNTSANDRILEIGMGNGYFVKDLLNVHPSITYSGIDFSLTMVEEANKINQSFVDERRAKFQMANAELMPFEENSFNKIFTINTIYFWENPDKVLIECKRVLQNNGILTITIRPKHILDTFPISKYGFTTFGKEDVCTLLIANGFAIKDQIEIEEAEEDFFGVPLKDTFVIIQAINS
jgi:ubiquinone/menaquinone biosynthesis C-methylase UbiE